MSNDKKLKIDKKYTKTIEIRNDSVDFVGGEKASYNFHTGEITVAKGDINLKDLGIKNVAETVADDLLYIHEHQHEIDVEEKGVCSEKVSLNEFYQRNYHMEVGALIAEKLEIRRQFMEATTEEEKEAFFEKFKNNADNKEYIDRLRSGVFRTGKGDSKNFLMEMEFIKNSSMQYRCDPNDSSYKMVVAKNAILYLLQEGGNVKSNPDGFEKEVRDIYNIGGFDFYSIGNQELYPMKNSGLSVYDKLLENGADANKVAKFMQESIGAGKISSKAFEWAEKLDVTGLSREQAEILLQTAIVAQESADIVAERVCVGGDYKFEFRTLDGDEQTALYLDIKRELWEKNGVLSEEGDVEKFNQLLLEAKNIELDCKSWLKNSQSFLSIARNPLKVDEFNEVKIRASENQGKRVNVDEYFTGLKLPLNGKSVEDVLANMRRKEEEDRKFWEKYYERHPEEKEVKQRVSDVYHKDIMNLNSPILADELRGKLEVENRVENLRVVKEIEKKPQFGDGIVLEIEVPKFSKAELRKITNDKGESIEVAMIDGQKHGAQIVRDNEGNILSYKLYDHGKEIDLEKNDVNLKMATKNGMVYTAVELNGQLFGAEILEDESGKIKASFYEQGGRLMNGADIRKNYIEGEFDRQLLKDDIRETKGENIESSWARVQEQKLDIRLATREKNREMADTKENLVEVNRNKEVEVNPLFMNNYQYVK